MKTLSRLAVRLSAMIFALIMALVLIPLDAAAATDYRSAMNKKAAASFEEGIYTLTAGGYALQAACQMGGNRTNVNIGKTTHEPNQLWTIRPSSETGYFYLIEKTSGKCADVKSGSTALRTNVQLYKPNKSDAQKWKFVRNSDGTYTIYSKCSGLVLDISGGTFKNGANIQTYKPNGTKAQKFAVKPLIDPSLTCDVMPEGFCTITNGSYALQTDGFGANVVIGSGPMTELQLWQIEPSGDGRSYFLQQPLTGRCLDILGLGTAYRTNVVAFNKTGGDSQKWLFSRRADGSYTIYSALSGLVLDISGGTMAAGTNIQTYKLNGTAAQGFAVTPYDFPEPKALTDYLLNTSYTEGAPSVVLTYLDPLQTPNYHMTENCPVLIYENESVRNIRDLGGWVTEDGHVVRYGALLRSAQIPVGTEDTDLEALAAIGITREVALLTDSDQVDNSSRIPGASFARYPVYWDRDPGEPPAGFNREKYPEDNAIFAAALRDIMQSAVSGETVLFHCQYGADRTGMTAFLLNGLLGVPESDLDKDYELTTFALGREGIRVRDSSQHIIFKNHIKSFPGETLKDKCAAWFLDAGFSEEELEAFRQYMLDQEAA